MLNTKIADLKNEVSKVHRNRLVAAGFSTVQDVIDSWDSEELFIAAGGKSVSINSVKAGITRVARKQGYKIVPRYELRILLQ